MQRLKEPSGSICVDMEPNLRDTVTDTSTGIWCDSIWGKNGSAYALLSDTLCSNIHRKFLRNGSINYFR